MKVERLVVQSCCNRKAIMFKLDRPIDMKLLEYLVSKGYTEDTKFTKAGLLYVNNPDLIVTGAFGSDKLQTRCNLKELECPPVIDRLEGILLQME